MKEVGIRILLLSKEELGEEIKAKTSWNDFLNTVQRKIGKGNRAMATSQQKEIGKQELAVGPQHCPQSSRIRTPIMPPSPTTYFLKGLVTKINRTKCRAR